MPTSAAPLFKLANIDKFATGPATAQQQLAIKRFWRLAIREFVRVAIRHVNWQTGMTRGSFIPLATAVQAKTAIQGVLSGTSLSGKRYWHIGSPFHKQPQTRTLGERAGQDAYNIGWGSPTKLHLTFEFRISTIQHQVHESLWQSLDAGIEAMEAFIDMNSPAGLDDTFGSFWV